MKKLIKFFALILSISIAFISGCNVHSGDKLTVYAPDGAPALALCKNIKTNTEFDYKIVGADKIKTVVTGNNPIADVCILPINNASNLLSDKEDYYMLGVVTHGNFYFLSDSNEQVTKENATTLIGKTIGVVQLINVPGLTLKACFNELEIPYQELSNGVAKADNKVNLLAINPKQIGQGVADYYLAPSPVADNNAKNGLNFVGSLHGLCEGESFPQAVLVAKRQVVQRKNLALKRFVEKLNGANDYLTSLEVKEVCSTISGKSEKGLTPTYNETNLNALAIERANINYVSVVDCKTEINAFIEKLKKVNADSVKEIKDSFYYGGSL